MDRSDLRAHVFGQERRVDPAPAAGHDRAQAGGGFKPAIDDRYSNDEIVSHGDLRIIAGGGQRRQIVERIDWR